MEKESHQRIAFMSSSGSLFGVGVDSFGGGRSIFARNKCASFRSCGEWLPWFDLESWLFGGGMFILVRIELACAIFRALTPLVSEGRVGEPSARRLFLTLVGSKRS